jgi:competence protein ComEC
LIVVLSALFWILLWVSAPEGSQSQIKQSYPEIDAISEVRRRFLESLSGISDNATGLVAGLAIGERNLVSEDLAQQMRDLSLTHLVAVSGANLAIVLGSIYFLTAAVGLSRNLRFLFALLVMACYVFLVGPESSVIRAATMALFVMLGLWLGRGSNPIFALSSAVLLLLILDPGLATDVGFGLSAFATAGLVGLTPVIYQQLSHMNKVLAAAIAATVAAQVYTLPIILYLQPSLPIYSVAANLLVEWVVAPVTILGMLAVIASIWSPLIASFLSFFASLGTQWIVLVSESLTGLPFVRGHFPAGAAGIALAVGFAALFTLWLRSQKLRVVWLTLLAALVAITPSWIITDLLRHRFFAGDWQIYACDVGQGDALLIRNQGQVVLIDLGPEPAALADCLHNSGVSRIDLLVLTHFDMDHVGGMEAIEEVEVGSVITSPFRDERPVVEKVTQLLASKRLMAVTVHAGISGNLGSVQWLVINPSPAARDSVDSNDASIAMVFDFHNFALVTLGDLGEEGQRRILLSQSNLMHELSTRPVVVKVAHHGSADQLAKFYQALRPDVALMLVGKNRYGHPTNRAIEILQRQGAVVLRTDTQGPLALNFQGEIRFRAGGKLST